MGTVKAKSTGTVRVTFPILGFTYGGGGSLMVELALARLAGVIRVYVNPATEMAYVEFDPVLASTPKLATALEAVGFRAGIFRPV
jgi:hypothetical protein